MLFLLAGSSLAQYIKYLIAPGLQTEQGTQGDLELPKQSLLPFQTVSLGAQPEAMPGKPHQEPGGTAGIRAGRVVWDAGRHFGMAAAVLCKTCCMGVCTSPGRPPAQPGGKCALQLPELLFCSFFKEAMQRYPLGYSSAWWIVECAFRDSVRWAIIAVKLPSGNFLEYYACISYSVI